MSTTQQPEPETEARPSRGEAQDRARRRHQVPDPGRDAPRAPPGRPRVEVEPEVGSVGLFDEDVVLTPSDDTLQWRAEVLQMVNWGGFSGRVSIDLHADATMISGASGVGKSTLLDAYTALMMPSDTRFNGASNDAVDRPRPRRRPAQPALLPARRGRRGRRPAHRAPGRAAAARPRRGHLGRGRDDVRQRRGAPLHRAAHLLRAAPRDPLRRGPDAAGHPRRPRSTWPRSRRPSRTASTPTP